MTNSTPITAGALVRFTASQLGLVTSPHQHYFEPETVSQGDTGTYVGTHPVLEDWHMIEVKVGGRTLLAPVHAGQFEVMPSFTITVPGPVYSDYLDPGTTDMPAEIGLPKPAHKRRGKGHTVTYTGLTRQQVDDVANHLESRGTILLVNDPPEERGCHRMALKTAATLREMLNG